MNGEKRKIAIYGGNGFVGVAVARRLVELGAEVSCISRQGDMPVQLRDQPWAQSVRWLKGDANTPEEQLLSTIDTVVALVGSPPLPTITLQAHAQQVFMNGTTNASLIVAAGDAGVKKLVLMGAKIPSAFDGDRFGYAQGKRISFEAAKQFSQLSAEHCAAVIQPGGIYGTRYSLNGKAIPIDWLLRALSKVMPSQLLSVQKVANCVAKLSTDDNTLEPGFTVIKHADIELYQR